MWKSLWSTYLLLLAVPNIKELDILGPCMYENAFEMPLSVDLGGLDK